MAEVTLVHRRFGGAVSLEQQLQDLGPHLPLWLRPLWGLLLGWLLPQIRRARSRRAMAAVDEQAADLRRKWSETDRRMMVTSAVLQARRDHPDAQVEAIEMPDHPCDAVLIEHPPDPSDRAQMALGFGVIEIRAPFAGRLPPPGPGAA